MMLLDGHKALFRGAHRFFRNVHAAHSEDYAPASREESVKIIVQGVRYLQAFHFLRYNFQLMIARRQFNRFIGNTHQIRSRIHVFGIDPRGTKKLIWIYNKIIELVFHKLYPLQKGLKVYVVFHQI